MDLEFTGEMWFWKGPSPHHFVSVPEDDCGEIKVMAAIVSYGWGMVPVTVRVGDTAWTTSLWPKDGGYIVPIKKVVQQAEDLAIGEQVTVRLTITV